MTAVKKQVPDITTRSHLDDRTTWTRVGGQAAPQRLVDVVEAGSVVDLHFGMLVHPGKRASFGTSVSVRQRLSRFAAILGTPCSSFKLLGVAYNTVKGRTVPNVELLTEKVQLRCDRVAGLARRLKLRRALLRSTVVSLIAWAGPWQQYAKAPTKKWVSAVDNARWGWKRPRLRSRLLGHSVVGSADSNVDFNLAFAVVKYEWHRAEAEALGAVVPAQPRPRWRDLCERWGWTYDPRAPHAGCCQAHRRLGAFWGAGLPSLADCRKLLIVPRVMPCVRPRLVLWMGLIWTELEFRIPAHAAWRVHLRVPATARQP